MKAKLKLKKSQSVQILPGMTLPDWLAKAVQENRAYYSQRFCVLTAETRTGRVAANEGDWVTMSESGELGVRSGV